MDNKKAIRIPDGFFIDDLFFYLFIMNFSYCDRVPSVILI
jgi:hypothetical protein